MFSPAEAFFLPGLLIFAFCAVLPMVPAWRFAAKWWRAKEADQRRRMRRRTMWAGAIAAGIYAAVFADAFLFEPNFPVVEKLTLETDLGTPLRLLHISDLHLEAGPTRRETWLAEQVAALRPDLIIVTGDTPQHGYSNIEVLQAKLAVLQAPLGVYACLGRERRAVMEAAAPHIQVLSDDSASMDVEGKKLVIVGRSWTAGRLAPYDALKTADYGIVINHTPDLADEAAAQGAALYLCGHTHGGQVRVPFYGAMITLSRTGKKYEGGVYQNGGTTIRTSRGFGLEPRPAPQVRFFCRPEIGLIELQPTASRHSAGGSGPSAAKLSGSSFTPGCTFSQKTIMAGALSGRSKIS